MWKHFAIYFCHLNKLDLRKTSRCYFSRQQSVVNPSLSNIPLFKSASTQRRLCEVPWTTTSHIISYACASLDRFKFLLLFMTDVNCKLHKVWKYKIRPRCTANQWNGPARGCSTETLTTTLLRSWAALVGNIKGIWENLHRCRCFFGKHTFQYVKSQVGGRTTSAQTYTLLPVHPWWASNCHSFFFYSRQRQQERAWERHTHPTLKTRPKLCESSPRLRASAATRRRSHRPTEDSLGELLLRLKFMTSSVSINKVRL